MQLYPSPSTDGASPQCHTEQPPFSSPRPCCGACWSPTLRDVARAFTRSRRLTHAAQHQRGGPALPTAGAQRHPPRPALGRGSVRTCELVTGGAAPGAGRWRLLGAKRPMPITTRAHLPPTSAGKNPASHSEPTCAHGTTVTSPSEPLGPWWAALPVPVPQNPRFRPTEHPTGEPT